ncbi:MAG: cytochrome c4 [Nevskiaceae bacterium]|jgi:cytochrome c553|nr:cytochrome c4 [Nevskiaceae bacterium]
MRNFTTAAAALAVLVFAATAPAAEAVSGDAAAGATKAATCIACHGTEGKSVDANGKAVNPEWPVLAGQNATYLRQQLTSFRAGTRINVVMLPFVQNITDQDIADLAAYFSTQTPAGGEADPSFWEAGRALYRGGDATRDIPACVACHGPVGHGNPAAGYPSLQAQHSVYTINQLNAYANGTRYVQQQTPNAQMMNTISARLTAEERRSLASYVQGIR